MTGIALSFPAGRYHATPWGRHVNEGAPEWPPSPWRLLRALVATWKRKLDHRMSQPQVESLLQALASPPEFVLPAASTGHTRHYMPWFKKGPDDKTLIFDAFVCLPHDAQVLVLWPHAVLEAPQREQLTGLLSHLNFFGRAEAWCTAGLLNDAEAAKAIQSVNCRPINGSPVPPDQEIVRVLCLDPERAFLNEETPKHTVATGKGKTRQTVSRPIYDPDWHLCMETLALHKEKWSDPPGSRWVPYSRPRDCFKIEPVHQRRSGAKSPPMQVARFALDSAVLPLVTETLPVAEAARRTLMGIYGSQNLQPGGTKGRSAIFSGKNSTGEPLEGHSHAYYLPADENDDGRLDHLTIVAADGFGPAELRALDRLREIKSRDRHESGHPLRVLLLGLGRTDDYEAGPLRVSRVWISATPFLASRHLKKRGTKRDPEELWKSPTAFLLAVLREELARLLVRRRDLVDLSVAAIKIESLSNIGPRHLRPIHFKRFRQKHDDDGGRRAAGAFWIAFSRPVRGPICLGHSSHFGLGLFMPGDGTKPQTSVSA